MATYSKHHPASFAGSRTLAGFAPGERGTGDPVVGQPVGQPITRRKTLFGSRHAPALAAAVVAAALMSACGGSDANTADDASKECAAAAPEKGTLTLPFINDDGGSQTNYPAEEIGAQAAVDYINCDLGGVSGYHLKLDVCKTGSTPAGSTTCANEAVTNEPIAVLLGTVGTDDSILAVTSRAGIPMVANAAFSTPALTSPGDSYIFNNNATAGMTVLGGAAAEDGVENLAQVFVNVPGAVGVVEATAPALEEQGLTLEEYPVPYPSPDLTSTFSAIADSDADGILLLVDATTCRAAVQAAVALGLDIPIYGTTPCAAPDVVSASAGYTGSFVVQTSTVALDSGDADAKIFNEAMEKYGEENDDVYHLTDGFQTIMNVYGAMSTIKGDITTESLTEAFEAGGLHAFLMGEGKEYKCDGSVAPATPTVCSLIAGYAEVEGGQVGEATMIDASATEN
jgi:branched-chain amino acid transport system substrate-binding protein